MNANAPTTASDPTTVPTAMPAIAPVPKPPLELPDEAADVAVTVALATVLVASPESKPAAVTLKQGTCTVKSAAVTKVWGWG